MLCYRCALIDEKCTDERFNKMDYAKESLKKHYQWGGKIEVISTVPCASKEDLSLAYTPGVA